MAAGLGFKTFTTGEVLTAADTNGYLMQGVLVFASSAARAAAITSPQEGQYSYLKDTNSTEYYDGAAWIAAPIGDITGVTAGTGISGGGTSGTVTITNSMATEIDAKGDLVAGTGADAFSRLAVGANDTVLTADSTAATGLKWAAPSSGGGMTVLASGSLSGSSLALTSISGAYTDLRLSVFNFNGTTTGYTVSISTINGNGNTAYIKDTAGARALDGTFNTTPTQINSLALTNNTGSNVFQFELFNYSSAVPHQGQFYLGAGQASGGPQQYFQAGSYYNQNSSAVTALTFAISTGTFNAGTYTLYGVK